MSILSDYFESIRDKRITVCGAGVSNRPLIELLLKYGCSTEIRDRKAPEEIDGALEWVEKGARFISGEDYLKSIDADIVFRTPGIRPDRIETSGEVTSEMELFFELCPCPIVAVTGSDGKTTTTTIISEMLKRTRRTFVGGNIGTPLLPLTDEMTPDDICAVELSSFQLMDMKKSAHIAVFLNFAPNHLDVHKSLDEYFEAKCNVFRFQGKDDIAVFSGKNPSTASLRGPGETRYFGTETQVRDGWIWDPKLGNVLRTSDIYIPGEHNVENYMAAIAALRDLVPPQDMAAVAREFKGVEHRLEKVKMIDGVWYVNDSIASSPTRTIAGLKCFKNPVILIAGGYDKRIPFEPLARNLDGVRCLILCGATAEKIKAAAVDQGYSGEIVMTDDIKKAVELARARAVPGDTVLFSPACASFDMFPNFAARGRYFKDCVNSIQ